MDERVGIPWLGHTCGVCPYCRMRRENLCDHPLFTGYTRDGGFATATIADARFAFPLGEAGNDVSLAPLLCAGLIGWRSLAIAGDWQEDRALWFRRRRSYLGASREVARDDRCLPLLGRETSTRRLSPGASGRLGQADPTRGRRSRSMQRSFLRPLAISCLWR